MQEALKSNVSMRSTGESDQLIMPATVPAAVIQMKVTDTKRSDGPGSWADTAAKDEGDWHTVQAKVRRPSRPPAKIVGSNSVVALQADGVEAVPRRKILAAYVGRLHTDTTEEELTKYLIDVGIREWSANGLLSKKQNVTFKTAAFYVTCAEDCRELFYLDSTWPEGAELRDWIYYSRQ